MAPRKSLGIVDLSEIRFRLESVAVAARLAVVVFGAGAAYVGATWHEPQRPLLAALFGALFLIGCAPLDLPLERIVRSRVRELCFFSWSAVWIAATAAIVGVDGGADSPLVLLFFLPLVFAALSYPLASVVGIGVLVELAFVMVASFSGSPDPVRLGFVATMLAASAVLCAWQAHTHERRRAELESISRADPLTGALNRRGFEERLGSELDDAVRHGQPLALAMLDLDSFKEINDTRGHAAGDEILRWTSAVLQEAVRPIDAVGRLGGDEFAILLRGSGQADAMDVAARVSQRLADRVTASTGVAAFPANGVAGDDLLRHADRELYAAKEGRRLEPHKATRRELSWAAAMAQAVDLRMGELHSARVAELATMIGGGLGLPEPRLALLRIAAMLHDVGKVSLPDSILRKPDALTDREYTRVKSHPVVGAELIARVEGLDEILPWIRHSHEHYDGSGYPDGLRGEAIPLESRILLVADAFDAMTGGRPYRRPITNREALEELRRAAGTQFDPRCVEALAAELGGAGLERDEESRSAEPARP
jgi:diguanylate cyclase (GGDEF)-like protein